MDILTDKSDLDLQRSVLGEVAKATNELACARRDLTKATSRLSFCLVILNELESRSTGDRYES